MKQLSLLLCLLFFVLSSSAISKTSTYSGTIKGYKTTFGFKTGQIFVNNVVTGNIENHLINIDSNGFFSVDFPLNYDKQCWVSFPFFQRDVYFVHGGKLVQDFDISEVPKVVSLFKGDGALVNNNLQKVQHLYAVDWDKAYNDVYQMSPEAFSAYFLALQVKAINGLDSIGKAINMDKKAYFIAKSYIKYETASDLIFYNSIIEQAYRIRNKIPFEDRTPAVKRTTIPESYYGFLRNLKYNDRLNMTVGNYGKFINRFRFIELIYDKAGRSDYTAAINNLEKQDTLSGEEKRLLSFFKTNNGTSAPDSAVKAQLPLVLKAVANTDVSLELDFINLQEWCERIEGAQTPLPDTTLIKIKKSLKNPFLFSELLDVNNKIKQTIEGNKTQTGYVQNETPKVAADSVFDNILNQYKGKTVFVDFWATWCSPCLMGIKEIAPLKEDLKNEDIVFLYLTNDTSPINSYNTMMPGIKGEHYRLTADEYNVVATRFGINGIPHYMLVNKAGEIVDKKFRWINSEQVKEHLLILSKNP